MKTHGLNPAQHDAVHTLSGPLLVLAGAGTGKTRVVTFRIAELIRHKTRPDRILAVTFTNKAAAEMQERVSAQLGRKRKLKPVIGTFHSHCVQVLRRNIEHLGYPSQFAIYDRGQQESLARSVLREIRVSSQQMRPGDLLGFIGRWKTTAVRPPEAARLASNDKEHVAAMAYRRYQRNLKQQGAVDFDDLLMLTEELFQTSNEVRRREAGLFDHVLVDEYQDTNASQYRIVKALASGHRNLCVVGDDDQSIYGWRGAEVEHILSFRDDWPGAKVVRLEENYRSTDAIVTVANRLIEYNKTRLGKVLRAARHGGEQPKIHQAQNETEEARDVVGDILRHMKTGPWEPRDFAILFRTNEQPRLFEAELRRVKLPYVLIGGPSFYDRREIRDVLAYLKVIHSPDDEVSLRRVLNTPARGIGAKAADMLGEAAVKSGKPMWHSLLPIVQKETLGRAAGEGVKQLMQLVHRSREQFESGRGMGDTLQALLREIGYERFLRQEYPDGDEGERRWEAIGELTNAMSLYESENHDSSLAGFLEATALGGFESESDKDKQLRKNAIVLMTLHSAKGLEFPIVYMVGMEEGLLPHHRSVKAEGEAIDEERRLCYVGVTRAMERLTLTLALTRMKWGKPRPSDPSRFLFEITGQADKAPGGPTRRRKTNGPPHGKAKKQADAQAAPQRPPAKRKR